MNAPFFIVGASRSGTTMLRLMLNAHSRLAVPEEFKYFNTLAGQVDLAQWRTPPELEVGYLALVQTFLQRRRHVFEELGIERLEVEILRDPERTLRAPYRIAAEAWARHHSKVRWGEKTPQNLFYADVLLDMFPGARFVYVARDPRAVVASMNRITYFSGDTVLNALNVRRAMGEGYTVFCRAVPPSRRFDVRYEDLVRDPEAALCAICTFLGERYEPGMLAFHRHAAMFMAPVIRTPAVTGPVSDAHTAKWKQTLRPAEVAVVESVCEDAMQAWGYEPVAASLPPLRRLDQAAKWAYWNWKGWQHRHRRGYTVHYPALHRTRVRLRSLFA
ncbi:MAG: sulfotransferase [Rhodothermaceae bacterium]|nr:sulfotransferase [Rhodothermaceae bacterium]